MMLCARLRRGNWHIRPDSGLPPPLLLIQPLHNPTRRIPREAIRRRGQLVVQRSQCSTSARHLLPSLPPPTEHNHSVRYFPGAFLTHPPLWNRPSVLRLRIGRSTPHPCSNPGPFSLHRTQESVTAARPVISLTVPRIEPPVLVKVDHALLFRSLVLRFHAGQSLEGSEDLEI
ncbi:hypothetical protein BJX63DRAFT_90652 [Aspergillus granulosus]|uniref:Uncharacterized protein n=1 Tax=Aspergillus granulosus TaxID=176169 RepID=A0ABR4GV22_9EURO